VARTRHVAATISLQAGVDIKVVQELFGRTTSTLKLFQPDDQRLGWLST
jgi:site-specific recombinase XerD